MSESPEKETTADDINIENIRQLTDDSKSDLKNLHDNACREAFKQIVDDSHKKIHQAAKNGRTRAYLYTWEYLADRSDKTYSFNGVRIMDILTKGSLLQQLRNHFNPDNDKNGYRVGWMRFQKRGDEPTRYGLYVSWYVPQERPEKSDDGDSEPSGDPEPSEDPAADED